ncbi:MAG: SDR family NAD(P)-dependent oxidoreductase [Candidatus Nitrosopolaris sp.]
MDPDRRVAVVIGSSSGIGFETSLALARNGFHTYATMRNLEEKSSHITEKARNENMFQDGGSIILTASVNSSKGSAPKNTTPSYLDIDGDDHILSPVTKSHMLEHSFI